MVIPDGHPGDAFLDRLADEIEETFGIAHATIQVETGGGGECRLSPVEVS